MTTKLILLFAAYLTLAASGWTLQIATASSLPEAERAALVIALVLAGAVLPHPRLRLLNGVRAGYGIAAGLLLFALPLVLSASSGTRTPAFTRVSLLALVPAAMVLISAAARQSGSLDFLGLLQAALAGLAGALLLLPWNPELLLSRPAATLALVALVASLSAGSYLAHRVTRDVSLRTSLLLLLAPTLVLLLLSAALIHNWTQPGIQDAPAILWDAAELVLLVHLVRALAPVSFSARFLLVPLITSVEGFVYLRPQIGWRTVAGAALLIFGSARLLTRGGAQPDSPLSLL